MDSRSILLKRDERTVKYLLFFIFNFAAACLIYDEPGFLKPLLQSVIILTLAVAIDLVNANKKKI
ncbi:hypothetical protein D3C73_1566680 [compost metagenome]